MKQNSRFFILIISLLLVTDINDKKKLKIIIFRDFFYTLTNTKKKHLK